MTAVTPPRPGVIARLRSRQSGHPSGPLGRIFGRAMVKDTAHANDLALALLNLSRPSTVLEVGFGQGRTVSILLDNGHRVLGVDSSTTMVRQATARNRTACRDGRATLRHGDGITIPFPDHSADAAITVHTLYFMPEPITTLAGIARVLGPGGTLVVGCRTADTAVPAWMDPDTYHIPTATQITAMLSAAGYDQVEHHTPAPMASGLRLITAQVATAADPPTPPLRI